MLDEAAEVSEALGGQAVVEIPIVGDDQVAFGFECDPADVLEAWQTARAARPVTGRWPVVLMDWQHAKGPGWLARAAEEQKRRLWTQAELRYATGDHTLGRSEFVITVPDPAAALAPSLAALSQQTCDPEDIDWELDITAGDYGTAPTDAEVVDALGPAPRRVELERWLLDWEERRPRTGQPYDDYLDWFGPDHPAVLLFPVASGWDTFVHADFYPDGGGLGSVGRLIAVVRSWNERFGAELVANWATMLQFVVERPPAALAEAWPLALEQVAVAPCTLELPGVSWRRHAQALVGRHTWFLHERP